MSKAIENEMDFQTTVVESSKTVLVDFWAPWCGPCRMIAPILEEIEQERKDIDIVKVNVDEQSQLASKFQVMNIPTLIVMKNGQKKEVAVGLQSKEKILAMLD